MKQVIQDFWRADEAKGDAFFKEGKKDAAFRWYAHALHCLQNEHIVRDELEQQVDALQRKMMTCKSFLRQTA